jgi:hypothetical protein
VCCQLYRVLRFPPLGNGSSSPIACLAGTSAVVASTECTACGLGSYAPAGAQVCTPCPAGSACGAFQTGPFLAFRCGSVSLGDTRLDLSDTVVPNEHRRTAMSPQSPADSFSMTTHPPSTHHFSLCRSKCRLPNIMFGGFICWPVVFRVCSVSKWDILAPGRR